MKHDKDCPFCKKTDVKEMCTCGAYRVTEDNYHLSMKERKEMGELDV